jgi:hypothetical protein
MNRVAAVLAVSSALIGTSTYAQTSAPQPQDSTINRHKGFALRLDLGVGYTSSKAVDIDASMKGTSVPFGLVIGGAVAEDFILGADFWGTTAFSPTLSQGGLSSVPGDTSFALTGFGLNLTYYFMPANIYVSLSPSITSVSLTVSGASGSTESGFGMKMAVGKEWWVSDHWGLGLAGQFFFASNKDKGTDPPTWSTTAFALAFSATYN